MRNGAYEMRGGNVCMQADLRIQVSDLHIKNETFTVDEMVALG